MTVSNGVAQDLARRADLPQNRIVTIYNPVVNQEIFELKTRQPVDHPWYAPGEPPLVLSVGRLNLSKDYSTLLKAFANLRSKRPARLMILGEGELRTELECLADTLGIAGDVALPGWTSNPFAHMARASLFVLSSAFEGLPTVLVEALACGCPVVSTDCPSGPAEILDGGRYGRLSPVGDAAALADAMAATLDSPLPPDVLRKRADVFSVDAAIDRYLQLIAPAPAARDAV